MTIRNIPRFYTGAHKTVILKITTGASVMQGWQRNNGYPVSAGYPLFFCRYEKQWIYSQLSAIMLPENSTVKQLENQIATLKKEKDALGLFKGKEKKALQEQIDNLNGSLTTANTTKNNAVAPIQAEIDELNKRIKEIETELTKDR